jgi:hypothetical protein
LPVLLNSIDFTEILNNEKLLTDLISLIVKGSITSKTSKGALLITSGLICPKNCSVPLSITGFYSTGTGFIIE